jgi:F5/8 type C domain
MSNVSNNVLFVSAVKSQVKNQSVSNLNDNPPAVKLVYKGNFYDMLPFIVVKEDELKRLNFPQDADDGEVPVDKLPKMSSNDQFSFSFATKPRETNAFAIDYDADTTEMSPIKRIGENQFGFGDIYGIKTLELRVIYPDGTYATYTLLFNIEKADKISNQEISTHTMQMHDNILDDANMNSQLSNNVNSEGSSHGPVMTEEPIPNEYSEMVKSKEEHNQKVQNWNTESFVPESSNECELNAIPVGEIQTDSSIKNSNDSGFGTSNSQSSQISLDLGGSEKICGIKVVFEFKNGPDQIRYFTLEFSNDGQKYTGKEYYSTSGTTDGPEIYTIKNGPVDARFVKITELGRPNSEEWIREVRVLGINES